MKLKIVLYPDPILGKVCSPIPEITDEIRTLARDMLETMYEAPGVGLAAPQVGRLINMVVYDPAGKDEPKQPHVIINPEVTLTSARRKAASPSPWTSAPTCAAPKPST